MSIINNSDMKKYIGFLLVIAGMFTSCFQYDDTDLRNQILEHENRIRSLEEACTSLNNDMNNLSALLDALQKGDMITSVTPLIENGVTVGYVITFTESQPITIYNGADGTNGQDGTTPKVSVRQHTDGVWYWTVDGEWLFDSYGNMVKATGEDGKNGHDGKDAVTPEFKIEDDYWYVSYDEGCSWEKLGKATGADGQDGKDAVGPTCLFEDITQDESYVYFHMTDGSVIVLPLKMKVGIEFDIENGEAGVIPGKELVISYTLTDATKETVVTASSDGNYVVRVAQQSSERGKICVKCPNEYSDGFINVIVSDGTGYAFVKVIGFYESKIDVQEGYDYYVGTAGGEISIPLSANVGYQASSSDSWIKVVEDVDTRAAMQRRTLKLSVEQNDADHVRKGHVYLYYNNTDNAVYETITITQSSACFSIERTDFLVPAEGKTYEIALTSSRGVKVFVPESDAWISASCSSGQSSYEYVLTLAASANESMSKRASEVSLYSSDGNTLLATLELIQLSDTTVNPDEMILTMRVNYSNDFTAYLPLSGEVDCFVDWGDGTVERYVTEDMFWSEEGIPTVSHKYAYFDPTTIDVKISGYVEGLYSHWREGKFSESYHTVTAIKQWGNLGLKSMSYAFVNNPYIESLPPDTNSAFAEVEGFDYAFKGCSALETVSEDLFASAKKVVSFAYLFDDCQALKEIPSGLFTNCVSANNFNSAFNDCKSLTSLPADLFQSCTMALNFNATFGGCSSLTEIPSSLFACCVKASSFVSTFSGCLALEDIPVGLLSQCVEASTCRGMFADCVSLKSIPAGLFSSCNAVTDFESAFAGCESVSEIPSGIFAGCSAVKSFAYVFGDTAIAEIPEVLFVDCTEATDFSGAFSNCMELKALPEGLFASNRKALRFGETFFGCRSLEDVPVGLFDKCRMVIDFAGTFNGCVSMKGESPYTVIDGVKYHLYERHLDDEQFLIPEYMIDCFMGCTGLSDYSDIPSIWK